jgi:peptide/nickel transport system substrate-binding protein
MSSTARRPTRTTRRAAATGLALALAAVTGLAGCATAASAPLDLSATESQKQGGDLTYLDAEIPVSAQVQESGTWQDRALQQNITDRLLHRNADTGALEPWLAESWTVSDDGLVYTFVIRDGVSYSDGSPLDVRSVERNLEWQTNGDPDKAITPNPVFPKAIDVSTDAATRTVTVRLDEPYAPFLGALTGWAAGLVSDATIDATREEQALYPDLIGSGPFVVESETYGKAIVLAKREGYDWAPPSAAHQGEAYLDSVTVTPVQEDSVRLGTLRAGQADLIRYLQPSEEAGLADAGFGIVSKQGVGLANQWFLKQTAPFLDDERVRRALLVGIDRDEIVDGLYTDNWRAASSIVSLGTTGYVDESAKLAYDPDAAEALLDEAGWTDRDDDGVRTRDGERLRIVTYLDVYDNTARSLFQAIQAQLVRIGVELDIKETDYSSYSATAYGDPSTGALRTGWPSPDPVGFSNTFGSASDITGLGDSDPEFTRLLQAHVTAVGAADRTEALRDLQDYVIDHAYSVPIIDDSQVYAAAPRLQGFTLTDGALPTFYDAWLAE